MCGRDGDERDLRPALRRQHDADIRLLARLLDVLGGAPTLRRLARNRSIWLVSSTSVRSCSSTLSARDSVWAAASMLSASTPACNQSNNAHLCVFTRVINLVRHGSMWLLCPGPGGGGIKRWCCLTSVWRLTPFAYIRSAGGVCGRPAGWRVCLPGPARPAWLKTAAARFRCRPGRGHIVAAALLQLVLTCAHKLTGNQFN